MKASLIVADAARAHPDGTISMLRAGIDRLSTPKNKPIAFSGALVARFVGTAAEAGEHDFEIHFVDQDGDAVVDAIQGKFGVPVGGGSVQAVLEFRHILPGFGIFTFNVVVDRQERAEWRVSSSEYRPEVGEVS